MKSKLQKLKKESYEKKKHTYSTSKAAPEALIQMLQHSSATCPGETKSIVL